MDLSELRKGDFVVVNNAPFSVPAIAEVLHCNLFEGLVRAKAGNGIKTYYEANEIVVALRSQGDGWQQLLSADNKT